jgi:hypothetical protein
MPLDNLCNGNLGYLKNAGNISYFSPAEMRYEDQYRLCYVRGPEGIIMALAEQLPRSSTK